MLASERCGHLLDIVEALLDAVGDLPRPDRGISLRASALVCRTWRHPAQLLLVRDIEAIMEIVEQPLVGLLVARPDLRHRTLAVRCCRLSSAVKAGQGIDPGPRCRLSTGDLFVLLGDVQHVRMCNMTGSHRTLAALAPGLCSLGATVSDDTWLGHLADMPQLRSLQLLSHGSSFDTPVVGGPELPRVERLSIRVRAFHRSTSLATTVHQLRSCRTTLRTLDLAEACPGDVIAALDTLGGSLTSLKITDLAGDDGHGVRRIVRRLPGTLESLDWRTTTRVGRNHNDPLRRRSRALFAALLSLLYNDGLPRLRDLNLPASFSGDDTQQRRLEEACEARRIRLNRSYSVHLRLVPLAESDT